MGARTGAGEIVALAHVQVAAPPGCETAAREFYGGLLGLEEIGRPPRLAARGGVWFCVGASELHVGVAEPFVPAGKAHPAFRLATGPELEALAARLEAAGVFITWADEDEIPGVRRFHANDPWGNRLELLA